MNNENAKTQDSFIQPTSPNFGFLAVTPPLGRRNSCLIFVSRATWNMRAGTSYSKLDYLDAM